MINVNDFKTGVTISYEGNLYQVLEFQHVKPGKFKNWFYRRIYI